MDQDFGVAKNSKVYFTDVSNSFIFFVDNFTLYLTNGYKNQARVSSNSWGCSNPYDCSYDCKCFESQTNQTVSVSDETCLRQYGLPCCQICNQYDSTSLAVDDFTSNNDESVIVIAAGNNGHYSSGSTVLAPASSKNSIAVGASYANSREYTRYDSSIDQSLYNSENLGYFSARGWTFDGRVKPGMFQIVKAVIHFNRCGCSWCINLECSSRNPILYYRCINSKEWHFYEHTFSCWNSSSGS